MNRIKDIPAQYEAIVFKTKALGFDMPSDLQTGSLLRTLEASKPGGRRGTHKRRQPLLQCLNQEQILCLQN
ncbi:hypothetical protein GGU45_004097 [Niabella hirudinis]